MALFHRKRVSMSLKIIVINCCLMAISLFMTIDVQMLCVLMSNYKKTVYQLIIKIIYWSKHIKKIENMPTMNILQENL